MSTLIMNKRRSWSGLLVVAVILIATLGLLGRSADWSELPQALAGAQVNYLLAGILCMMAFFTAQAINSRWLLTALGYQVTLRQAFKYALLDFYFSAITPCASGGQPAQMYFMQKDGISIGSASLAILLFNMTYHVASVLLVGVAWLYCGAALVTQLGIGSWIVAYGVAVHVILVIIFAVAILQPFWLEKAGLLAIGGLHRLGVIKEARKAQAFLTEQIAHYQQGASYIKRHWGLVLRVQLMTVLHLLALFSIPFCIYQALCCGSLGWLDITGLQAMLSAAVDTLPLPGGVGAAEGGFVLLYQTVFAAQILPAMLLCRSFSYYGVVAVSGIVAAVNSR